uniref:MATH domain-containing protein n=1 Tax=Panagrolaimus sp. PS1159 TaxID=55785 RepID=A0AC35G6N5_9BILA
MSSTCKFAEIGCDIKDEKHEDERLIKHMLLLCNEIKSLKRSVKTINKMPEKINNDILLNHVKRDNLFQEQNFIWKITNWSEKIKLAKDKKMPWQLSPSFYSEEEMGYHLIAMIAPFGYSKEFGKSLAIYIEITEGENDRILEWPFSKNIKFTLFTQNPSINQNQSINCEIKENELPNENEYRRQPKKDKPNQSFGITEFCSLKDLENYSKNDEIYIGINIY